MGDSAGNGSGAGRGKSHGWNTDRTRINGRAWPLHPCLIRVPSVANFGGQAPWTGMQTCSSKLSHFSWSRSARFGSGWPSGSDSVRPASQRGKAYSAAKASSAHRLQAGVPAAALRLLPQRLALAGQRQVVLRPQQDQVIDDRRLDLQGRQLDAPGPSAWPGRGPGTGRCRPSTAGRPCTPSGRW